MEGMSYETLLALLATILQPAVLLNAASIFLSLICSYVPNWRDKWAAKDESFQRLAMLITVTAIVVLAGVLSFTGVVAIVPFGKAGIMLLIFSWLSALWTNQTTYKFSPQVDSVKAIRVERDEAIEPNVG